MKAERGIAERRKSCPSAGGGWRAQHLSGTKKERKRLATFSPAGEEKEDERW